MIHGELLKTPFVHEGLRRAAKNIEGHWEVPCVKARSSRTLLLQIAVQLNVNEPVIVSNVLFEIRPDGRKTLSFHAAHTQFPL